MQNLKFIHKVSRGSRFNQIYIPKEMRDKFQAGDVVEVVLLEKKSKLYFSPKLKELSEFKTGLIEQVFYELKGIKEVKRVFIVGSFLTQKSDYNDIDLVIISNKDIEKEALRRLDKFELKFHVNVINEESFEKLEISDPLTRSMLYYFVSDSAYSLPKHTELDKNHLEFLLMMPEDILKLKSISSSRLFYDNIRRLIAIERFLEKKEVDPLDIESELKGIFGEKLRALKLNQSIEDSTEEKARKIIKSRLESIEKNIEENGKK